MVPEALISSLLVSVAQYTGYAIPGAPPVIQQVSHASLAARFCAGPCDIRGLVLPEGTILLDQTLAIGRDLAATSILVHELTHFLQEAATPPGTVIDCALWTAREEEAYSVQYQWLRDQAPTIRLYSIAFAELGGPPMIPACRPNSTLPLHP
jgi:hypothetical protein